MLRSDTLSRVIDFKLLQSPTASDPRVVFRSARGVSHVDRIEHKTLYRREIDPLGCMLPSLAGVILGGALMDNPRTANSGLLVMFASALATVPVAIFQLTHRWPTWRHTAIRRETVSMESSEPLDVDVALSGTHWRQRLQAGQDCLAELDISSVLNRLPSGREARLEANVADMPDHARSLTVNHKVIDALIEARARERRLKEAEAQRKREAEERRLLDAQEQRIAETRAASGVWRALTPAEQSLLNTCFDYAGVEFQIAVTEMSGLKTYGDFLAHIPERRILVLRQIGQSCGRSLWSMLLQQKLGLPAYLAEKILR